MRYIAILVFMVSAASMASAQGQVAYDEQPAITMLMQKFISSNKAKETVSGWRVQILATTDRAKMESTKRRFLNKYGGHTAVAKFDAPYYKLRVGTFRTKLEAEHLRYLIAADHPTAYVAKDNEINITEFFFQ